jgi:hypothetical protein
MSWQVIVALVVAVPVILLPVVLVWFLNLRGVLGIFKAFRAGVLSSLERRRPITVPLNNF